jgi:hypothetical protein
MLNTEKPPIVRKHRVLPEQQLVIDFIGNREAVDPFEEWLSSGSAWVAFGEWYDGKRVD